MKTRTGMIGIAAILTAAALSGGVAQARSGQSATTKPAAETVQTTDTDSLQQGDQTSPDAPAKGAAAVARSASGLRARAATAKPAQANSGQGASDQANENQGENANEGAGESQGESESANDGPGGHQDPPGDVQHEGGNNEK